MDGYVGRFYAASPRVNPVAPREDTPDRVFRGGGFNYAAVYARSATRNSQPPSVAIGNLGVRPARGVTK